MTARRFGSSVPRLSVVGMGLGMAAWLLLADSGAAQQSSEVPVTIKELDVDEAVREFQGFQNRLGRFREEIGEGRTIANETAQILEDLRGSAAPENAFNEGPILEAISAYVDGVLVKQVELVDFLESQRYRISYYANKMAAAVRPEQLAPLFGTVEQNDAAIVSRVRAVDTAKRAIAAFIDSLPPEQFDRGTYRPRPGMSPEDRRRLNSLVYEYQYEMDAVELAKERLKLVRAANRTGVGNVGQEAQIDADLLVGRMFGALDRIRLQMSIDLMYLEHLLDGYARSARTQEILEAFQNLVEMQGDLEGPSPELASVLDWLQDSSTRRISLGAASLSRPGIAVPRSSELLREAYEGAHGIGERSSGRD